MQPEKSPRHLAALAYAAAGIPVFPCLPGDKVPATANGFHDATLDPAIVNRWWAEADFNVAYSPEAAGWCVIDIDGDVQLDLPETYTVKTPRGQHLYFEGSLPPSASKLADHVDTRGVGSYVLAPPSIVDGKTYEVLHDRDIAELPAWVTERVRRPSERHASTVSQPDTGAARTRARSLLADYVRRGDVAISGRGGDNRTYQVACELLNLGVSPETARELLEEIWNPHCQPPWTSEELDLKIYNAARFMQNEAGAWGVEPGAVTFRKAVDNLPKPPRSRFYPEDEQEQDQGPDPSWLIPALFPERSTILMVGQTGSYKSFLALDLALSIASGQQWSNTTPLLTGPVFYAAAEGRHSLKKARRRAWKTWKGLDGGIDDFYVMPTPLIAIDSDVREFGDQIKWRCGGRTPRLIVLDTVAKCMAGLNENDAKDAGMFIQFCDSLVDQFRCSVVAVHHQSDKDGANVVRGSSALRAGFDTLITVKAWRATKAVEMRVLQHKDADEPESPWTFEGKTVGPALVFQPTTHEEHMALTGSGDAMDGKKVGAALKSLNALGAENAVTTHVLAATIAPAGSDEGLITKVAKALHGLAKEKLKAYCEGTGRDVRWFLP